jgi:hypothetical protein
MELPNWIAAHRRRRLFPPPISVKYIQTAVAIDVAITEAMGEWPRFAANGAPNVRVSCSSEGKDGEIA